MNGFEFFTPTHIIFGRGSIGCVAEEASKFGRRVLVVTDPGILSAGLAEKVTSGLEQAEIPYLIWSDVAPNPRDTDIERCAAFAAEKEIDCLIAIGGGSVMDTAKAVGVLMTNGGTCEVWCQEPPKKPNAPLICIPTTCGTGSEVTHEAIVNNTKTLEKDCIWGPTVNAAAAVLDSEMLDGLPGSILASTGLDALTHAVEAYVCKAATPLTDAIAIKAVEMIGQNLERAVHFHDPEALDQMMAASAMAGMAFGNSDVASIHSISEALGGYYDIPHGIANAMMLAPVSRFSIPGAPKRYAQIARALGVSTEGLTEEEAAFAGVARMEEMVSDLKIPKFSQMEKVNPEDFRRLAHTAALASETEDNPVAMSEEDFFRLFTQLYDEA